MSKCPFCAESVGEQAAKCPKCGAALAAQEQVAGGAPALYGTHRTEDVSWQTELHSLVSREHTIEAIKLFRERTGTGLKEAKDAVEAVVRGEPMVLPGSFVYPGTSADADLIDLLRRGQKIEAIKLYRERTGTGLREAKEAVERLAIQSGIVAERAGCLGIVLIGTAFFATISRYF